ncbi:L-lactate dehydrogenase [Synchytrium microbalum]|uniref:L-lactate dehydrogenase n=1 Tax=Synchytrium microbalum TaxID=1806994 RepID=A0A507C156_9FUNG|nr:L-lactate dehydrogenase [Synchytrium microbalum]TPX33098.1 L-lactate dehydrogenase [Synchytrium microbalum]
MASSSPEPQDVGSVGSTCAYACILRRVAPLLLLVDIDAARCEAEVLDLQDSAFVSESKIKVGTFKEAGQCDIVIITAGAKQRPGETRVELIDRNHAILRSVFQEMSPMNPHTIVIIVANPCDVLTYVAQKISQLPPSQILGSGTMLDSSRLRSSLSNILKVSETAIHAYVMGEHGDSQFVGWSTATVGNTPLLSFPEMQTVDRVKLAADVKNKAYKIIEAKGSTYYGIGGVAASIAESCLFDTRQVRPVSHLLPGLDVCLSAPAVLGRRGLIRTLLPPLSADEGALLESSAKAMRAVIDKYT